MRPLQPGEQGSPERQQALPPASLRIRKKAGLETPLKGRFFGENRLMFAPPLWYDFLVLACIFGGGGFFLLKYFTGGAGISGMAGLAVSVAGIWGAISSERIHIDLRSRRYMRLEGQGLRKRILRGSLDDLDALVLITEHYPHSIGIGMHAIYRLVLHWKMQREPLLVVERQVHLLAPKVPINQAAGMIRDRGYRFARAMQIQFYDNSHFLSPAPVPVSLKR